MSIYCPKCESANGDDTILCSLCGHQIGVIAKPLVKYKPQIRKLTLKPVSLSLFRGKNAKYAVIYKNPTNGYVETSNHPALYCFLFGCFYFAAKGIWTHFVCALIIASVTFGISWFVYPFYATAILRTHYERKGWVALA